MVAVDGQRVAVHRRHHHFQRTPPGLRVQAGADTWLGAVPDDAARMGLHQLRVTRAEAFFRRHRHLEARSEEHTSELQSRPHLVCRLLLEKKKEGPEVYCGVE